MQSFNNTHFIALDLGKTYYLTFTGVFFTQLEYNNSSMCITVAPPVDNINNVFLNISLIFLVF